MDAVDRFGAQAVLGRPLYAGEIKRMVYAETVVRIYRSQRDADNLVAWTNDNPASAAMLMEAESVANGKR